MRKLLSNLIIISCVILVFGIAQLIGASGTPSTLVVRTDANNYLLVTSVTQTNPVTQGVFSSRTLRTDSNGSLQVVLTGTVTPTYPQSIPASTCASPSLGESGAPTTGIAFTATPSILMCVSGTAVQTITGSSITSTIKYLLPDGTAGAPPLAFSSNSALGIGKAATQYLGFTDGTSAFMAAIGGSGIFIGSGKSFGWSSTTDPAGSVDLLLNREGAGYLIQRNSTSAQRLSVANTYTSSTNNELFSVDWQTQSNVALVGTVTANTGTARALRLIGQATNNANAYSVVDLGTGPFVRLDRSDRALGAVNSTVTGNWFQIGGAGISTATTGTVVWTAILPTYNQASGNAANTDLLINRTQTAVGSGSQRLIDLQVGNTSKFYVTADGTSKGTTEVFTQATAPTCTAANNCGTGNGTFATGSNDAAGSVTLGTTPASGFIITFAGTYSAAPVCTVWMNKAGMVVGKQVLTSVTSTTTITVVTNGTAPATGDIYAYRCTGLQ